MQNLSAKIGVVTGGGTGIGRELARQLVAEGCHLAICDVIESNLNDTIELCQAENPRKVNVTGFVCDVADELQVQQFCQDVQARHATDHINLLINNAAITGGGSFVQSSREEWERTFNICWSGVYLMTRTFLPLLLKSTEGHLVNMSSANALRAVLGGQVPHTAYSSAKFAVRGFSEALIHDFRFNAPHVSVSVVMAGAVGTELLTNSARILGNNEPKDWTDEDIKKVRQRWIIAGVEQVQDMDDDQIRARGETEIESMRNIGLTAAKAAGIILNGVKNNEWRILIGDDTVSLDELVRDSPEDAYDPDFVSRWREAYETLSEQSDDV